MPGKDAAQMTDLYARCINCRSYLYHASGSVETDAGGLCRTCLTMLPPKAPMSPFNLDQQIAHAVEAVQINEQSR